MSSPAQTLEMWVRLPLEVWISVCLFSVCAALCVDSGLATGLIPRHRIPTDCFYDSEIDVKRRSTHAVCSRGKKRN
jgi:hypothetical protein